MKVENALAPEPDNIREFMGVEGPVLMVNLLKFREKAAYPDGRDPELSGREAYERYAEEMEKLLQAHGGGIVFSAEVAGILLGQVGELWDHVGIARYPSSKTLIEIASSEKFQEIEVHRTAGLAGQLNLTCTERPLGH